ncbi:S8 family peptidase [Nakamurella lactea]|uniref:S8 family peptidase n=1 Tax=Nakamurella lactea TaxID=459515 RepID=UPI00048D8B21|nr:S8 family serine peptidase [Nakamurella lactea]
MTGALLALCLSLVVPTTAAHGGPPTAASAPPAAVTAAAAAGHLPSGGAVPPSTGVPAAAVQPADGGIEVTLITGDVVTYPAETSTDQDRVQVRQAPRPDGRTVAFTQLREGDSFYVFPSDARGLVGAGLLDKGLFDVRYLARNGYADKDSSELPVIVQYPTGRGIARAAALPAVASSRELTSVNANAVRVSKSGASTFWASVQPAGNARIAGGFSRMWLDPKVKTQLDVSVPMIGAPQAWQRGLDGSGVKVAMLDTGVDLNHPDLVGHIGATAVFSDDPSVQDGNGHGTHVASTIVGSGAASAGRFKGVAPGADLIVGKVLDNNGEGWGSQIIAGMQWASEQGAKIVSISIGSAPSDGTDPMSEAVNQLSAEYGTLFVIAAGNNGISHYINAPGAAEAALTVGAVDKQDQLASFTSRGPRLDEGLKPNIAAPGKDITAARAEGTQLGPIVDGSYTTISGTSMATPHVAGAAAILAEQHPDWTGPQLANALTSSAKDDGYSPYEQGAGRVDVARATTQPVRSSGQLDFGAVPAEQAAPISKTLTYTNDSDQPITLTVTPSMKTHSGTAPADTLTVDRSELTVPANGTADVTVILDVRAGPPSWYEGAIEAADATRSVVVRSAVGAVKEPAQVDVTIEVVNPVGATDVTYGGFLALRLDDGEEFKNLLLSPAVQNYAGKLPAGVYSIGTDVTWTDAAGEVNHALVTEPTVDVHDPTKVVFDLRKAQRVEVKTQKPGIAYHAVLGYRDVTENSKIALEQYFDQPFGQTRLWTLPTKSATRGTFVSYTQVWQGPDPLTVRMRGKRPLDLHPSYQDVGAGVTMLKGHSTRSVVAAGHGTEADFATVDVRGKIALLDLSDLCPAVCDDSGLDRVQNAKAAGAVAVLGYSAAGREFLNLGNWVVEWPTYPIPTMSLTAVEGRALTARLQQTTVTLDLRGDPDVSHLYALAFTTPDKVPGGRFTVADRNLARTVNRLHADAPGTARLNWQPMLSGPIYLRSYGLRLPAQSALTTYSGPTDDSLLWFVNADANYASGERAWSSSVASFYRRPGSTVMNWGEQPLVPAGHRQDLATAPYSWILCGVCRNGDVLSVQHYLSNNGIGAGYIAWGDDPQGQPTNTMRLYRGDDEIPVQQGLWGYFISLFLSPFFELPQEVADYRMTEHLSTPLTAQRYARTSDTSRTFRSGHRDDGLVVKPRTTVGLHCTGWYVHPLVNGEWQDPKIEPCQPLRELYLGYEFGLGLDNTVRAGSSGTVTITGYHSALLDRQPRLTGVKLWLSYDDGKHWSRVATRAGKGDTVTARVKYPAYRKTTGAVSIRAEGVDDEGNTISQTIPRAFGLAHHG